MSTSPSSFRRSRIHERTSSQDMSSSLFRRFHGKKSSSSSKKTGMESRESTTSSQPPPRHSHCRILSRDCKRSVTIYYTPTVVDVNESSVNASVCTDDEMSEEESPRSKRGGDRFDAESNGLDLSATQRLKENLGRSRGGPLSRMSQSFSRASEKLDTTSSEGCRRAAKQSAKYDVTWRQDDESTCCRVCFAMFTKLSRRRHHCRVCGELVCGACSQDQVSLTNKFKTPRRACVACCTLLQAMARAGDDRVEIVKPDATSAPLNKKHHHSASIGSTCESPIMLAPAATPRYRDRITEVHRIMAAAKLSRRRGSSEKKMYVISSRWLRSWLAFTSSASTFNTNRDLDYEFEMEMAVSSPHNDTSSSVDRAPEPIDNLSLLELSCGKLMRRPGLIRDDVISGDPASTGENADFQLLSPEVWEVFQRLYGGAPAIYVNLTSADPMAWNIDVSDLLAAGTDANGSKVSVLPVVERALINRHKSEYDLDDARGGSNQVRSPTESSSHTPVSSQYTTPICKQRQPKSPAWTVTSSSSSSSWNEEKNRARSPVGNGNVRLEDLESDVAALSIGVTKTPTESEDDMRTTTSVRSPAAAYAASAFAVAMKQARLNAQKAIDDRASRVIAA